MKLKDTIWFFDIDDTLIDTAGANLEASGAIYDVVKESFDESTGRKIQEKFNEIFNLMVIGYRVKEEKDWDEVPGGKEAFEKLMSRMKDVQSEVYEKFKVIKKWSREMFIKFAADEVGAAISPEVVHEAADAYWLMLTEKVEVFEGAKQLFKSLHDQKIPIFLITSSDSRLKMKEDGKFKYIPEYSEGLKRQRIELLRERDLDFRLVSIGDPEDKPDVAFFNKGINLAKENLGMDAIDYKNCIMVGDSYGGDLETPQKQMGFGKVILFKKDLIGEDIVEENLIITNDLHNALINFEE